MRATFFLAALAATALGAPGSATVRAGVEAWQQGDHARAVAIWRALAEQGDSDAAFNLGQAHRLGRGVAADSSEAKRWFERAARAGHLDAQVSLGLLLFDSGDRAGALDWLKRAAERGEPRALLVTGTAMFNGDGIRRDAVLGYAYVSRAAAQGLAPAKETLADMDKVMPLDQRQQGLALALAAAKGEPPAAPPAAAKAKPAPAKARPAPPPAPAPAAVSAPGAVVASAPGGWRIQLGAFSTRAAAQSLYGKLKPSLGGTSPHYVAAGAVTRLQVGPFAGRAAASAACARLKPQPCFPVKAD